MPTCSLWVLWRKEKNNDHEPFRQGPEFVLPAGERGVKVEGGPCGERPLSRPHEAGSPPSVHPVTAQPRGTEGRA